MILHTQHGPVELHNLAKDVNLILAGFTSRSVFRSHVPGAISFQKLLRDHTNNWSVQCEQNESQNSNLIMSPTNRCGTGANQKKNVMGPYRLDN